RMGDAGETMLAMSYMIPGMPLIYSGQEYGLDHRLLFFEKDSIPKEKGQVWDVMERLGKLKNENPALNGGKNAADYTRLTTSQDEKVLALSRSKAKNEIVFIANMSDDTVEFDVDHEGEFRDYLTTEEVMLAPDTQIKFQPWEYKILLNN